MSVEKPAFVTLTGIDRLDYVTDFLALSMRFPLQLECGVLVSLEKAGTDRFPDMNLINRLRGCGLRLSAHLCGSLAEQVFSGKSIEFDLTGFSRVQVNLLDRHATSREIEHAIAFAQRRGIRLILQCGDSYPEDPRCDWLMDNSFGQGQQLASVPDMSHSPAFCGISGGLGPENVNDILRTSVAAINHKPYWIDAESALIEAGRFSPDACTALLGQVFNGHIFNKHSGENS